MGGRFGYGSTRRSGNVKGKIQESTPNSLNLGTSDGCHHFAIAFHQVLRESHSARDWHVGRTYLSCLADCKLSLVKLLLLSLK